MKPQTRVSMEGCSTKWAFHAGVDVIYALMKIETAAIWLEDECLKVIPAIKDLLNGKYCFISTTK